MTTAHRPPFSTRIPWRDPYGAALRSQAGVGQNLLQTTLARPFALRDWPNPTRPLSRQIAVLSESWVWQNPNQSLLLPRFVIRTPLILPRIVPSWLVALSSMPWVLQDLLNTTLQVQPTPFHMHDWPVPKGQIPARILVTWVENVKLNLLGQDQFFGAPGEPPTYMWPNPKSPTYLKDLQVFLNNINMLLSGGVGVPTGPRIWRRASFSPRIYRKKNG